MTDTLLIIQIVLLCGILILVYPIGRKGWIEIIEYRRYLLWERATRPKTRPGD